MHFELKYDKDWLPLSWITLSCTFKAIFSVDGLDNSFFISRGKKTEAIMLSLPLSAFFATLHLCALLAYTSVQA